MIPTIEQIVEDLLSGVITKSQAVSWLHQHAEDAHADLRDHFAGLAMNTLPEQLLKYPQTDRFINIAEHCYKQADAMLYTRTVEFDD